MNKLTIYQRANARNNIHIRTISEKENVFVNTMYYFQTDLIAHVHRKGSLAHLGRNGGERSLKAGRMKEGMCPRVS